MKSRCARRRLLKAPNDLPSADIIANKTLIDLDLNQRPCDGCISLISKLDEGRKEFLVYCRYNTDSCQWRIGTDDRSWIATWRDKHVGVCVGVIRDLLKDW